MWKQVKELFYKLPIGFLLRNIILLESKPDMSDNTYYVYKELLKRNINDNYRIVWFINDINRFSDIREKNVYLVNRKDRVKYIYYSVISKYIIDCNEYIHKLNKNQFRIHLAHGMPIKNVKKYGSLMGHVDAFTSTSDFFNEILSEYFCVDKEKIIVTGYPRTDQFYIKENPFYFIEKYNKVIAWMPTYRKTSGGACGYDSNFKYGVPCINESKQLEKLNDVLNSNNCLLLIKLHPIENEEKIKRLNFSNILFTKNEMFENNHYNIYHLLSNVDALITDYSSVYYDFLLTNKPVGMAVPDLERYKEEFGIAFDDFESNLPAHYIYSYDDLCDFIYSVINNEDMYVEQRKQKCMLYNKYNDGKSSKRVVDILVKELNRKTNK